MIYAKKHQVFRRKLLTTFFSLILYSHGSDERDQQPTIKSPGTRPKGGNMLSEIERENVVKAAHCAALLVSDVKAVAASSNPLLAELGLDVLKAVTELEQRLKRLEAITTAN